jgi:ABC-2 type transport system permease protein
MFDTVRAELFKLRKRPAAWVLLAAAAVLNQIFGYLIPYLSYLTGDAQSFGGNVPRDEVLASTLPDQLVINTIGGFPVFAGALALVFGALMFGGEYGWGTVKTMLTQRRGRISVLGAQLVALARVSGLPR